MRLNCSVQFLLFLSLIGARTLKMPVPYPPPNVGAYTRLEGHPLGGCESGFGLVPGWKDTPWGGVGWGLV